MESALQQFLVASAALRCLRVELRIPEQVAFPCRPAARESRCPVAQESRCPVARELRCHPVVPPAQVVRAALEVRAERVLQAQRVVRVQRDSRVVLKAKVELLKLRNRPPALLGSPSSPL